MKTSLCQSLALLTLAGTASAASITVVNGDFETGGRSTDSFSQNPGVIPVGWQAVGTPSGSYFGYYNPNNFDYPGTWGGASVITNMAGPNLFYFGSMEHGQGIQQTLSATLADQTHYALTVAVGGRFESLAYTSALDMRLLAGSTLLASTTVRNTANNGTFINATLNYLHNPSFSYLVGQPLTIQLLENNTEFSWEMDIDNVRLESTSAIPEPATAAGFAGLALLGFSGTCRRRRAP